jgi:gliding motility-associated-like protein
MVRTGTSGHVDVTVQLNTTDTDFMLPALPSNADGSWYMYLHTGNDFNTGTPIAKQMTSLGGGLWRVTMTPAETNLYGFFTFGCKLNASVLNLNYCTGDTFTLTGSFLAAPSSCAVVQFDGPSVLSLTAGGSLSNTNYTVVSDGPGECLDVLQVAITVPSGSYDINVERDATAASCGTIPTPTSTSIPRVEKQQITVSSGAPVLAGFDASYGSDTVYACVGENNIDFFTNIVNPIINVNSSTGLTVGQLITTGPDQVLVYSGAVGRHQILISSLASCGVETLNVVIKAATPSSFTYQYAPACLGTVDSIASLSPTGGYFELTAPASGILVDSLTGAVNTAGGTSGIYLITYLNTDTTCFTPSVLNLNVPPPDQQTFSYPVGSYCTNSADLLPTITNYSHYNTGYFVFDSSATGETITVDSTSGAVLFSTASGPDTFTIRYENGTGITPCGLSSWANVTVISPTPFTFSYGNDTLCAGTGLVTPTIPLGLSNYAWFYDTAQIDLNPVTGAINTNTSTIGGPYTLSLEADGSGCRTRTTITLWINGLPGNSVSYPSNYYCETDPSPLPLFLSGTAGGTFNSPTGLIFSNINTGQVNLVTSPKNIFHQVLYTPNNSSCPTSVLIEDSLYILLRPDAAFTIDSAVCRSVGTITANAASPGTGGYSLFLGPNLVQANVSTDVIPLTLLPQDGSYRIQKILDTLGACLDTANQYFQILPLEDPDFNYSPLIACENTQYVDPFIYGNGGGTFTVDSSYTLATIVDPVTGRLDLDSSGSGWHGIIYSTNGPCPASQLDTIRILRGFSSYFTLALSVVCESNPPLAMDTVFEYTAGNAHFFSEPAGLSIDPITGTISPQLSVVSGLTTYDVFHVTGGTGFCPDTTKSTFRILEFDDNFAIEYGSGPHCTGTGVLTPVITALDTSNIRFNQPVGLTYADTTRDARGAVDLRFTRQGNYEIRMQKDTECAEIARDSLIVLQSDNVDFSYGLLGVCKSNAIITPNLTTLGGLFSAVAVDPRDTIVLDSATGALNVGLSTVGFYNITYATTGICPGTLTQTVAINANPIISDVTALPGFSFCVGDTNLEITAEGSGGSYSWFVQRGNLPLIPYGTGAVLRRNDFQLNDTLWLKISSPTTGCRDSVFRVMEALAKPMVSVVDTPLLLSGTTPFEVALGVSQDGSAISWYQIASSGDLAQDSAITDVLTINDVASIANSLDFDSDYDPVTVTMYFRAVKNGCEGDVDSLVFIVNPSSLPIFIPEVMTPNGDGPNDEWEIQYNQSINPDNYTIEVYNRSGGKVYTLPNLRDRWGGGNNPDGVYWWLLRDQSGVVQQYGGLTIRRQ